MLLRNNFTIYSTWRLVFWFVSVLLTRPDLQCSTRPQLTGSNTSSLSTSRKYAPVSTITYNVASSTLTYMKENISGGAQRATLYIAIPGQRCLLALISREYAQLVQRTTGLYTCTCIQHSHLCLQAYIHFNTAYNHVCTHSLNRVLQEVRCLHVFIIL